MPSDMPQRPKRGVLVYYEELENGSLRLTLDDAVQDTERPALWKRHNLFTYKDFGAGEIEQLENSEGVLSDIGLNVLARLNAFRRTDNE